MNNILDIMLERGSRTARVIQRNCNTSLKDYLKNLIPGPDFGRNTLNEHRERLIEIILDQYHLPSQERLRIKDVFNHNPFIQIADGSNLLFDTDTFYNNYFSQLICKYNNLPFFIAQQCSRNKLLMAGITPPYGCGVIELASDFYNLFDLTRTDMQKKSVCTLNNVQVDPKPYGIKSPIYSHASLPTMLQPFIGKTYEHSRKAFEEINKSIWLSLKMKAKKKRFQIDEHVSAQVIADHIHRKTDIFNLLFQEEMSSTFIDIKNNQIGKQKIDILRNTTDYFYYNDDGVLKPIRQKQGSKNTFCFQIEPNGNKFEMDDADVIKALSSGVLFPDLIMSYIVMILAPNVLAIGGSSQHEYLATIYQMMEDMASQTGIFTSIIKSIIDRQNANSRMISGLIEATPKVTNMLFHLSSDTDLDIFENAHAPISLKESMGDMSYFSYFNIFFNRQQS